MSSSRLKNWKIIPTWRRRYRAAPVSLSVSTRWLPTVTAPLVGRSKPAMRLSSVDFPLPDGPMIATDSPRATSMLTCATAGDPSPSYRLLTSVSCTRTSITPPASSGVLLIEQCSTPIALNYAGTLLLCQAQCSIATRGVPMGAARRPAAQPATDLIWLRSDSGARDQRPALSRDQIVRAAVELADEHGLEAVSTRRIAAALGAGPTS